MRDRTQHRPIYGKTVWTPYIEAETFSKVNTSSTRRKWHVCISKKSNQAPHILIGNKDYGLPQFNILIY